MREFWNSEITSASWIKLQELNKGFKFMVIGGWAVYLYTKLQKSKDIDIVIDYSTLRAIESKYRLEKNERLSKYEVKLELFDIDIYVPRYSKLALPADMLLNHYATHIEGFEVPVPEALIILKLGAARERSASEKGDKDSIDILGMLFYSGADMARLSEIAKENNTPNCIRQLKNILENFNTDNTKYLNLNEASFAKLRRKHLEIINMNL